MNALRVSLLLLGLVRRRRCGGAGEGCQFRRSVTGFPDGAIGGGGRRMLGTAPRLLPPKRLVSALPAAPSSRAPRPAVQVLVSEAYPATCRRQPPRPACSCGGSGSSPPHGRGREPERDGAQCRCLRRSGGNDLCRQCPDDGRRASGLRHRAQLRSPSRLASGAGAACRYLDGETGRSPACRFGQVDGPTMMILDMTRAQPPSRCAAQHAATGHRALVGMKTCRRHPAGDRRARRGRWPSSRGDPVERPLPSRR